VTGFEIRTAEEFAARRAARERPEFRRILQLFVERGGPVPIDESSQALVALDDEDLIRIRDGKVDVAYPFTASPTPFVVRLPDGQDRFACCAVDALGIAPMIGQPVEIRSRCHHCGAPLDLTSTPEGPRPEGSDVMLWIGQRADDRCKIADSL
jgi:hypothetical protein